MSGDTLDDWFAEDDGLLEQATKLIEAKKVSTGAGGQSVWSTEEDGSEKAVVLADAWEEGLIRDAKGHALFNQYNVAHTLRCCPEWDGVFAFNEFTGGKWSYRQYRGQGRQRSIFTPVNWLTATS